MRRGSTIFLRGVVIILGAIVLALCLFALPVGLRSDATRLYRPIVLGLYVAAIPFFVALYQALRLLDYIDNNNAFSQASVSTLKNIKYCALAISGLFAAGMPYIYFVAGKSDAPGGIALVLVIIFASMVFAAFAAVLQKLLQNALDIKAENDLTV